MNHFCSCKDHSCPYNPHNKSNKGGCDRCIQKCLNKGEIPACFFNAVSNDQENLKSFTYGDFANFYFNSREKIREK